MLSLLSIYIPTTVAQDIYLSTTTGEDGHFSQRRGHTSVVLSDGNIVLMGGYMGDYIDDTTAKNDVWKSDDGGETWIEVTNDGQWQPRGWHESVVLPDDTIILMGGSDYSNNEYYNDVWRSTDQGTTWEQMTESAEWGAREALTGLVLSSGGNVSIVIMGGCNEGPVFMSDIWVSNDQGASWSNMVEEAAWSARAYHTIAALSDGSFLIIGGQGDTGTLKDVWHISKDNGSWSFTQVNADADWVARGSHTSVVLSDDTVILMGGYNYDDEGFYFYNDIWKTEGNGATWTEVTPEAEWISRYGHTSVVLPGADDIIILIGGMVNNWQHSNQVWRSTDGGENWMELAGLPDFDRHFFIDHQADDLWGYGWDANSNIDVTIEYVSEGQPDSLTIDADDHGEFWVNLLHDYGVEVGIGDTLELTQGNVIITHTVINLTVDEANPASDSMSGTAEPGSEITVEIHGFDPDYYVKDTVVVEAGSNGEWIAYFEEGAIETGSYGSAEQFGQGASTRIHWHVPEDMLPIINWHPLAGDWNGDGSFSAGLYDPEDGVFHVYGEEPYRYGPRGQTQ